MKNQKFILTVLILLAQPIFAEAAPKKRYATFTCHTIDELNARASDCEDNVDFSEAAVLCYRKLQKFVDAKTAAATTAMAASNLAHTSQAVNSQTKGMAGAANDYQISMDTLDEMLNAARQANRHVNGYLDNIYMPEDIYRVDNGDDIDDILLENACYAENQEVMVAVLSKIDQMIKDFEKAKKNSGKLQLHSNNYRSDQSSLNAGAVKAGKAVGPKPAAANKQNPQNSSSITGLGRAKQDDAAMQKKAAEQK